MFKNMRVFRMLAVCVALFLATSVAGAQGAPDALYWEIYFDLNSTELHPQAQTALRDIARVLGENPKASAMVTGHTCDLASPEYNRQLALKRAEGAADYLSSLGIAPGRLGAVGMGVKTPRYDNTTPAGKRKNRRVEITVAVAAQSAAAPQPKPVSDDYILTSYVSVVDDQGNVIRDLNESNFNVYHGKSGREIVKVVFEDETDPAHVALALDQSASMKGPAMYALKDAANLFVKNKKDEDKIQIIAFSSKVLMGSAFSPDREALSEAINKLQPGGYTRLYDALFQSAKALAVAKPPRILILMTDGVDEQGFGKPGSNATLEQAIAAAQAARLTVITVGLGDKVDANVLSKIAASTRGTFFYVPSAEQLDELYARISHGILRGKYRIDFKTTPGTPGQVVVKSELGRVIGYR